jgi:hypothetical protein
MTAKTIGLCQRHRDAAMRHESVFRNRPARILVSRGAVAQAVAPLADEIRVPVFARPPELVADA